MNKKIVFSTLIFIFLVLFNLNIIFANSLSPDDSATASAITESSAPPSDSAVASTITESSAPSINSRSAVVIDRNSKTILFGKNEYNKVKMASTTKIMTCLVVLEHCNLNETVTVSQKSASTGGSRVGLKTGDKCSVNDLLYGLMLYSGNDTAVALAEHVGGSIDGFAELMNQKASELGLANTHFKTPHGLDKEGHYTTAYELAILSNYALNNETFKKIVNTKTATININGNPKTVNNTNELLGNLNGVYGIKTGFTNGANRCLVTACKRGDLDIISVVLGADTKNFRTQDSIKLIEYTFKNFVPTNISEIARNKFKNWKDENLDTFEIYKPSEKSSAINLELENEGSSIDSQNNNYINSSDIKDDNNNAGKDVIIPIKKSEVDNLKSDISCETYITPPLNAGSILGKIDISSEDKVIYSNNIILTTDIFPKTFTEYFINILKNLNFA